MTTGTFYEFIARDGRPFCFLRKSAPPLPQAMINQQNKIYKRTLGVRVRNARFTEEYNCHGLTFAAKLGWFDDVRNMLNSHGYTKIGSCVNFEVDNLMLEHPVVRGDIILYFLGNEDNVTHTGIIWNKKRRSSKLELTILSKWGNVSEYFHRHDKVPNGYGKSVEIWTDREI